MNFLKEYPDIETLMRIGGDVSVPHVNGHIHTPYSFSSFDNISQIFDLAKDEEVDVLGINDFFVCDGYNEFYNYAVKNGVFPLFNVEFIGLIPELQRRNVTINDPNNPGRIYFSGKGLNYPYRVSEENKKFLDDLIAESQKQVSKMIEKVNYLIQSIYPDMSLTYDEIKKKYAKELVRERHIAKAIRILVEENYPKKSGKKMFYTELFDVEPKSNVEDIPAIENEIRGKLLKAGGSAFVPESPASFPAVERIREYILDAGGIPCYPVLLDDRKGNLITGFESDWEFMDEQLKAMNVHMVELIPSRNSVEKLREFIKYFTRKGYVISLGSEHNTPGVFPLEVKVDGEDILPEDLKKVSYDGACVIAAHQYLKTNGQEGFVTTNGNRTERSVADLMTLGNAVIKEMIA
ncbi:PHP domain-containing protein [uncultured Draconibacterium sp.]|uniref:PHP domain-containing protein n=1 Tax=uncultured Draconibacterium sp. TaxID=1573823 RepID=UPI002AA84A95|nr:PHP domain-containing protein [uncultured Draconibacterium sp.]